MGTKMELLDLARHLKQERLFITSERQHLQSLNEKVCKTVERLFHLAWIAKQQRINLEGLILSRPDCSPSLCCQRANILEATTFQDAYKQLGFHEPLYGDFLQQFRATPKLVAMCLVYGESMKIEVMHHMVNVVMASIYGHCIFQEDEKNALFLLKHLMELQLAASENPRRLLRHGSCAFSRVYKSFNEGLFSAKLFLTAALHDPVMHLLMEDELFLDIDPGKAVIRFPAQERLRRFGQEGTPEYKANLQKYRLWTITKLVNLTNRFISSIKNNMHCLPPSLIWLVKQLYNMLMKAKKVEVREVGAMCADLVFYFFICEAIVNPEPYGIISDTPISYIARFNLMQVAQILHVLAMSKWEEIDQKLMDLYGRFEKDCMSSLLDSMLEGAADDAPPDSASQLHGLARTAVLISESDLMVLVSFLRSICAESNEEQIDKKMLEMMLSSLPPPHSSGTILSSPGSITSGNSASQTPPQTPNSKRTILSKVGKKTNKTSLYSPFQDHSDDHRKMECEDNSQPFAEEILIISLNNAVNECPGMLPEHKVLSMEQQKPGRVRMKLDSLPNEEESIVSGGEIQEKRTRFSLSHDQDSIGTSDNLEAISEAASNHSVASSLELENENENDNLSDMVSANVSGRGTPNVSGRDTPSSQIEGEEREQRPLDLPVTASKQNPEDIDDKFGKFEFKPLMEGDEAVSMVSDTWSTDVLASDSEMVEQSDQNLPERPLDDIHIPGQGFLDPQQQQNIPDIADTASEAWSTDVMASDSERLQDLDTDDTGSVARSDDTASVARSDDTARSEVDGDIHPEHLHINVLDHGGDDNITPRASGSRSPIDEVALKSHHPGDLLRPCPLVLVGNQSTPQTYSFQPIRESSDSFKIPEIPEVELRPKHIPVPLRNHSSAEETKASQATRGSRGSENQQNSFNKASTLLQTFDPLAPTKLSPSSPDRSVPVSEHNYSVLASGDTNGHCEVMGMQTLGRLSLTLGELPDNGSLNTDNCVFAAALSSHSSNVATLIDSDVDFLPLNSHTPHDSDKEERANVNILSDAVENSLTVDGDEKEKTAPGDDLVLFDSVEKEKPPEEKEVRLNVRLSSVSLISSSSSSSSSGSGPVHNDITSSQETTISNPSGAIPKSISFDKTAERGDKEVFDSEDPKHKKSFFKGFKFAFKGRSRKSSRSQEDGGSRIFEKGGSSEIYREEKHSTHRNLRRAISEDPKTGHQETSDIILEKYRKKPTSMIEASISNPEAQHLNVDKESIASGGAGSIEDDRQPIDLNNPESSFAFADAKRKLRLVLSAADVQTLPWMGAAAFSVRNGGSDNDKSQDHELVAFLKMQLAEAVNLQDRSLIAQLHETLRCVHLFDKDGCKKLFRSLREDYKKRAPYIAYLVRCRQGLLSTLAHLERVLNRIERDKIVCNKYMISMCVRFFLQQRDIIVKHFVDEFQKLTVSDEKTDLVEQFLQQLYREMETDFVWQAASEEQTEQAQVSIERSIMSQMYIHAMYPNGDGDVMRDKLFYEHIQKLSKVLTPNHKYLRIAKVYHYECPWPAAQAEIVTINAYKTPRDKLQCVLHCCNTIMNLLRLANEKSIPAADDFMPVLVFVLVKANPPNLLSSIQYVNSFYHKCIQGEDEYWWTQFCAAIEFIKTMEYDD